MLEEKILRTRIAIIIFVVRLDRFKDWLFGTLKLNKMLAKKKTRQDFSRIK